MKNFLLILALIIGAGCIGCKKSNGGYTHNPSQPITVNNFSPATGTLGTEVLIKGSNFTSDTSKIKVSINGVPLLIVGVNGDEIIAVVTTKTGSGPINVSIDGKNGASNSNYTYIYSYSVSTLAGSAGAWLREIDHAEQARGGDEERPGGRRARQQRRAL